jgi:HK97 family phage prohead protease
VLFNHNIDAVLGRKSAGTARFWEDAAGLHYEADLPDTQAARDLKVSLERGDIKESSAAFYILESTWENRSGIRTRVIQEARLVEGSPHSFAAYGDSTAQAEPPQDPVADHDLEHYGARLQLLKIA